VPHQTVHGLFDTIGDLIAEVAIKLNCLINAVIAHDFRTFLAEII
jgi:hypothetical protein